jgi:hypothetical protein
VRLAKQDATCQDAVGMAAAARTAQDQAQAVFAGTYAGELHAYAADLAHAEGVADSLTPHL